MDLNTIGTLVCIATVHGKYIGKFSSSSEDEITVDSVVEMQQILTNQGPGLMATLIGTGTFNKSDSVMFFLDKKSPLYTQYFQTVSGLTVAHGKI